MKLESDDPAVRKAAIINLSVEAATMVISLALMTYAMKGEALTEVICRKIKQLRVKYFGPPPPTEDQIKNSVRQVHIEAAKILREAE